MAQSALETCEICMGGPGTQYCTDCEQYFCENCKLYHLRARATKVHVFIEAADINTDVKSVCQDHNDSFVFICQNCDLPVCIHCVAGNHNGHRVTKIEEAVSSLQKTVRSAMKTKLDAVYKNVLDMKTGINKNELEVNTVIIGIQEDGNKIKAKVDKQVADLIEFVKEKDKQERAKLIQIQTEIKQQYDKGNELDGIRKKLEQSRPNADLVTKLKKLLDDIFKLKIVIMPTLPSITYTCKETTETDLAELMGRCNFRETELFKSGYDESDKQMFKFKSAKIDDSRNREVETSWPNTKKEKKREKKLSKKFASRNRHLYRCGQCENEQQYNEISDRMLCPCCDNIMDYIKTD